MKKIHGYPKVFNLGHKAILELFFDSVVVEEKIDGSQFSFKRTDGDELICKSKNKIQSLTYPNKMFKEAIQSVQDMRFLLHKDWTYRCEYLQKKHHNTLTYDRIPEKHLIVFDIDTGEECYLNRDDKEAEARRIGLEFVPVLYIGKIENHADMFKFLNRTSVLGGSKIEGIVFKNYERFDPKLGKCLMGKYVRESFREKNQKSGAKTKQFILNEIANTYKNEARWEKAIMHLEEDGELTNSPKDIGLLIRRIIDDIKEECEDEIKDRLFKWAWKSVCRRFTGGFPEWYKDRLAKQQFNVNKE